MLFYPSNQLKFLSKKMLENNQKKNENKTKRFD